MNNTWNNNYTECESNDDRNKILRIKEYLDKTKRYLEDILNNLRKSGKLKIQLTIAINFIYFKGIDEKHVLHSKSDNIKIMTYDKANEVKAEFLNYIFLDIKLGWENE